MSRDGRLRGAVQQFLGRIFVDQGDDERQNCGTNRKPTEDWMQKKCCRHETAAPTAGQKTPAWRNR